MNHSLLTLLPDTSRVEDSSNTRLVTADLWPLKVWKKTLSTLTKLSYHLSITWQSHDSTSHSRTEPSSYPAASTGLGPVPKLNDVTSDLPPDSIPTYREKEHILFTPQWHLKTLTFSPLFRSHKMTFSRAGAAATTLFFFLSSPLLHSISSAPVWRLHTTPKTAPCS